MRASERAMMYTAVLAALGLGLVSAADRLQSRAHADARAVWADGAKIASCDVFKVAGKLMSTEPYEKLINAKRDDLKAQLLPLENDLKAIGERLKAMGPSAQGPEAEQAAGEFQKKQAEYLKKGQDLDSEMSRYIAEQNFDAYKKVLDSVSAVAEKRGYTHVFSTRGTDEMKTPANPGAFLQGVLARPLAKSPAADDITDDVMADLKLS